jgi:hypothetical protein
VRRLSRQYRELKDRTLDLIKFDHSQFELIASLREGTRAGFAQVGRDIGVLAREAGLLEEVVDPQTKSKPLH